MRKLKYDFLHILVDDLRSQQAEAAFDKLQREVSTLSPVSQRSAIKQFDIFLAEKLSPAVKELCDSSISNDQFIAEYIVYVMVAIEEMIRGLADAKEKIKFSISELGSRMDVTERRQLADKVATTHAKEREDDKHLIFPDGMRKIRADLIKVLRNVTSMELDQ